METKRRKAFIHYTLLTLIIVLAASLRINTFWAPHVSGDEFHYLGMALKLDSCGLDGYNIRGLNYESFSLDGKTRLIEIQMADDTNRGMFLDDMYARGRGYYDNPLYNNAPGLSYLLMFSQKTLGKGNGYFVSASNMGNKAKYFKPETVLKAQFYAVFWPFFFSLLFVLLSYIFGRMVFDRYVGLIAAFLIAVNPVSILVSQKLWGDEISGVFVLAAAILFYMGYKKRSLLIGLFTGILIGIAVLFKQTAGFFIIALVVFYFWDNRKLLTSLKGVKPFFINPFTIAMAFGFVIISSFWFLQVYEVYGEPIHKHIPGNTIKDVFAITKRNRPPGEFIYLIGIPFLSPFFIAAWAVFSKKIRHIIDSNKQWVFQFIALWIFSYFLILIIFFNGKEHRYMLAVYPAIAVLSAFVINQIRIWGNKYTYNWKWLGANEFIVIALIIIAHWSVYFAMKVVYGGGVLILAPF